MILEQPRFESADSEQVYQYVERNGTVESESVRDALDIPEAAFQSVIE